MTRADVIVPVALARLLRNGETVFHSVAASIPMVAIQLARHLHAPDLVYLNIAGGVNPTPQRLPVSSADPLLLEGARSMLPLAAIGDLAARGRLDTLFLSAAQIDRMGRVSDMGLSMLMSTARRVLLWYTRHDPQTFVEQISTVAVSGNVAYVVTPLCVFWQANGRLLVESVHPGISPAALREQTGFFVEAGDDTPITPPPTIAEINALAAVDPEGVRKVGWVSSER